MRKCLSLFMLILSSLLTLAQDAPADSLSADSLINALSADGKDETVIAAFKSTRLILTPTSETMRKKNLNFMVVHRFGDVAGKDGGSRTLWGLDNSSDIYIGFEYGLSDKLDISFGRSKFEQLLDLGFKYKVLEQKGDGSMPFALTVIAQMGLKPYEVSTNVFDDYTNRLSYFYQAVFSRKFSSRFSLVAVPSFLRNNLPFPYLEGNEKNIFSVSVAGRLKVTKRMGIVADYVHPFSSFRKDSKSPEFYAPSAIGIEVETGGHVFTVNLANAQAISPINYIADTESKWTKGQYRIGFTITRVFSFGKKEQNNY